MENYINQENLLLYAVNVLLGSINELPIENEEDYSNILEARIAKEILIETKRAVLSEGWDFNTDTDWTFPRTSSLEILVPFNVLDITTEDADIIMRNWKLYSKSNKSHVFEEEVSCTVVWDLDFNSLTHALRHYITLRAARIFQGRWIGDRNMVLITAEEEEKTRLACRRSESRTGQYNVLTSAYGTDNRIRT